MASEKRAWRRGHSRLRSWGPAPNHKFPHFHIAQIQAGQPQIQEPGELPLPKGRQRQVHLRNIRSRATAVTASTRAR